MHAPHLKRGVKEMQVVVLHQQHILHQLRLHMPCMRTVSLLNWSSLVFVKL